MSYSTFASRVKEVVKENRAISAKEFSFPGNDTVARYSSWEPAARIPQLEELIKLLHKTGVMIAGGAILGSYAAVGYGDIDIFPLSDKQWDVATKKLMKAGYEPKVVSEEEVNWEHKADVYRTVQLIGIHTDTDDAYKTLQRFDLSVCQIGVVNGQLLSNEVALRDIERRVLRCTGSLSLHKLQERIAKYKQRGFRVVDEPHQEGVYR